jgi:hypothetical protein
MWRKRALLPALLLVLVACEPATDGDDNDTGAPASAMTLDEVAERYVKLALALRPYDSDYVDAYFGPAGWASDAEATATPLTDLRAAALELVDALPMSESGGDEMLRLRRAALEKRLTSMVLRMEMAEGRRLPFDDESAALFDAVAPDHEAAYFQSVHDRLDALVPGEGPLNERLDAFREQFEIPKDRLAAVFDAAVAECRRRTLEHIALPADESFTIEYVTDQPWSGYNWYKGNRYSLIQINTDLPIYISRAVDLGCHEGYPGHHTFNVLTEERLVNERGWIEFTLHPLYGPQSLISEGSANYGIEMAFTDDERREFEERVLFPLAGLDASQAHLYYDVVEALEELSYVDNEAARDYLNGALTREETVEWLMSIAISPRRRAEQRVRFIETYRSYVINYNLGRDLVAGFITARAGDDRDRQWVEFERLLSRPLTPSDLR